MYVDQIKVKNLMSKNGIVTQTELAKIMGITKGQLSIILSEEYNPFKSNINNLCKALNASPLDILYEEKSEFSSVECHAQKFKSNRIRGIELFAGAGGLALGLEDAGIDSLAHIEIDKYCCDTLKKNRPNWNVLNTDISKVDFAQFKGKIEIVTGGFPCQAFSYAGKKLGFEDVRGTLFYEFARCVKETDPIMFMAENVRGLISHDNGRTIETILEIFKSLGYEVKYKLLNAVDYGVPQKRERVVIIGTKEGVNFEFPKREAKIKTIRDALKDVPESEGQTYSKNKKAVLELVPPGGCWRNLPIEIQKSYMGKSFTSGGGRTGMARRIAWDEPSLTLTCSPSQKQTERCHPEETRPFTVREYARIQTFPDDWTFSGSMGEKYKQIGNAVPVLLAKKIGIQIVKAVEEYKLDNSGEC